MLATTHTSNTTAICEVAPPANTARGRGNVFVKHGAKLFRYHL
jgi:hypothetical protein